MLSKLQESITFARQVGKQAKFVQGSGGNLSWKAGNQLWITASGSRLGDAEESSFVELNLNQVRAELSAAHPHDALFPLLERAKICPSAPSPSVETPVHAIIPYPVVIHLHDTASLTISGARQSRLFLKKAGLESSIYCLPFTLSGLPLAKRVAQLNLNWQSTSALLLEHHGLFIWGKSTSECWFWLCDYTQKIEKVIAEKLKGKLLDHLSVHPLFQKERSEHCIRWLSQEMPYRERSFFYSKADPYLSQLLEQPHLKRLTSKGMATAEHLVQVRYPLVLSGQVSKPEVAAEWQRELRKYKARYKAYFQRYQGGEKMHLPYPNIILVRGLGMITAGASQEQAGYLFTCYQQTAKVLMQAEQLGSFSFLPEKVQFEIEYFAERSLKRGGRGF